MCAPRGLSPWVCAERQEPKGLSCPSALSLRAAALGWQEDQSGERGSPPLYSEASFSCLFLLCFSCFVNCFESLLREKTNTKMMIYLNISIPLLLVFKLVSDIIKSCCTKIFKMKQQHSTLSMKITKAWEVLSRGVTTIT